LIAAVACSPSPRAGVAPAQTRGGDLMVSTRAEPQSLNPMTKRDTTTQLISVLTHARLFRVNAATQDLEPWLVDRWSRSSDGLEYRLTLKPGVLFSDGAPLTADDVVFSLSAVYAPGSVFGDALMVDGKPLHAEAVDPRTVVLTFPTPFSPGLRLLDALPILPKHKLHAVLTEGRLGSAWNVATPLGDIAGLGPFILTAYAPGERLTFTRNGRYFRKDPGGTPLPYLDRIVVEIVPDQDAQMLKLQSGQSDTTATEIRAEDYAQLKRAADAGSFQILETGTAFDADAFWINLAPGAFAKDPRRSWIQRDELRQAISLAVDRQIFVDTVFLGAATPVWGPISPENRRWYSDQIPRSAHDPARARMLLASVGLTDRNSDGLLDDASGQPAHLTLLTAKGQTPLERGAFVIRDELRKIGLTIDVVPLEPNALVQRFVAAAGYDAVYFHLASTDIDPAMQVDFWRSNGGAHVWNLGQAKPSTEWEGAIDGIMARQVGTFDDDERTRLFVEVQKIFGEHLPVVSFAAPRLFIGASRRMTNLTPAVTRPQLLWAADTIAVTH
jgi:peptide/nickel transport system substrate-binding protein